MTSHTGATDLDLTVSRVIRAPRQRVWDAWIDPEKFAQWWVPAPAICEVVAWEPRAGGALRTRISEDGGASFAPHLDACFLAVDEGKRIVFTTALTAGWRPAQQPFVTAITTFADHADGTEYTSVALHKNPDDRAMHEELGFYDGWGTVIGQLATFVERDATT